MPQFVLSQFVSAVAVILGSLLTLYTWLVIAAAILSWVSPDPRNPIVRFLYGVTEPVLYEIRRRLPFVYQGGFDFSPLVLLAGIMLVQYVVVASLHELAVRIAIQGS